MKTVACLIALVIAAFTCVAQSKLTVANGNDRYPNELPTLKLYRDAKWNSLRPFVSTDDDIVRIFGKPVRVYNGILKKDVSADQDDFNWTIVVSLVGKGGFPDSVVDRLFDITLYPKRRVSLVGADFSAFHSILNRGGPDGEYIDYYDGFGLRYSVYNEDAADGRFHKGDLKQISYGASEEETETLTRKH